MGKLTFKQNIMLNKILIFSSRGSGVSIEEKRIIFKARRSIEVRRDFSDVVDELYHGLQMLKASEIALTPMATELLNDIGRLFMNGPTEGEIIKYLEQVIGIFLEQGVLSDVTSQVLVNAKQRIVNVELPADELIQYVSDWLKEISSRQRLLPDEKKLAQTINYTVYLSDLSINRLKAEIANTHTESKVTHEKGG